MICSAMVRVLPLAQGQSALQISMLSLAGIAKLLIVLSFLTTATASTLIDLGYLPNSLSGKLLFHLATALGGFVSRQFMLSQIPHAPTPWPFTETSTVRCPWMKAQRQPDEAEDEKDALAEILVLGMGRLN